jgi:calmodulin
MNAEYISAVLKMNSDEMYVTGTGKVNLDGFVHIASHFLEEEDAEAMQEELKEAFRLYDREGT